MNLRIVGGRSGASTKLYIDGELVTNCTRINYEVVAGGLARVTLDMAPASVEIEVNDVKVVKKTKRAKGKS